MRSRMRESASTDLREPQGSNPLGPPGPELQRLGPVRSRREADSRFAFGLSIAPLPNGRPRVADGGLIAGLRLARLLDRAITLRRREQKSGRLSPVGTRSGKGEVTGSAALDVGEFEDGNAIVRAEGKEELVDLAAECLDGFAQFPGAILRLVEHGLDCGILIRPLKQKMGHDTVPPSRDLGCLLEKCFGGSQAVNIAR